MAKMTEGEIATVLEQEISLSQGGEYGQDSLMQNRRKAWNYYLGRQRGDEDAARSQLQSLDVADQTEHMLAQMMQAFTTDCPAEFEPAGPDDDTQAQVESATVNKIIMEDSGGYEVLYTAIKDALLFKNGIIKVYVDETSETQTRTFDNLTGEDAQILEASLPEGAEIRLDGESATISQEVPKKFLRVEAVEPASFHYEVNWPKQDLQDIRFAAERKFFTRSDLLAMGFPKGKVEGLPAHTLDTKSDSYTKNLEQDSGALQATTKGQDKIEVWECYVMLPRNLNRGASDSQRWRVIMSERVILDKEPVDMVPYVSGSAFIVPHRFTGLSLFDKLKEIQDAKTAGMRQWTDNLALNNFMRLFLKGDINVEDLADPTKHVRGSLNSEAMPLTAGDLGTSSLQYLNYMDKTRAERGGAAIDLGSPESQLVNSQIGATGVAMVMGAQEQMAGFMSRTISETLIRRLFLMVHRVAREQWRQPVMMQMAGQWVEVNPADWKPRTRVNVKTGLTPGERARKSQALMQVIQTQLPMMQAGSPMFSDQQFYNAFMNWAKCAQLDNPEQYATHYASPEYQQRSEQAGQAQQQQQELAVKLQTMGDEVKMAIAKMEDQTKRAIAELDAEVEQMKVIGTATTELELERVRAESESSNGANPGSP